MTVKFSKIQYNRRTVMVLMALLITLAIAVTSSYGAFVGNGNSKGVLVESEFNFNSNILSSISNANTAEDVVINTALASQDILIRNYSKSSGEINHFDVTYTLSVRLSNYSQNDVYRYFLHYGSTVVEITNSTVTIPNLVLPASQKDDANNTFSVEFRTSSHDENPLSGVIVTAVPQTPGFMTSKILGGMITKNSTAFSVVGNFNEITSNSNIDDYVGFIYSIVSNGVALPEQRIKVSWDANKLEFDKTNQMLGTGYTAGTETNGTRFDSITLVPNDSNRYFTIDFFRTTDTDFWSTATAADLANLVSVEIMN